MTKKSREEASAYHLFKGGRTGLWQQLLGWPDHRWHNAIVKRSLLFCGFFKDLSNTNTVTLASLPTSAVLMGRDTSHDQLWH